jgi:GxxExxY protein
METEHGDFVKERRRRVVLLEGSVTARIIGAAIEVHRALGPGLLESAYEQCLCHELGSIGLAFERQVELPLRYKDVEVPGAYRIDVVVERTVLLELKAIDHIARVHEAQLLTYLRLTGLRVGLILNFGAATMKDGIVRRVV